MLHVASNSSNTTDSTCNLVSMLRSIGLSKLVFHQFPLLGFWFDLIWYVIEDTFLDQKPLKNPLLQLVAGWPTFGDEMPGLYNIELIVRKTRASRTINLNDVNSFPIDLKALSYCHIKTCAVQWNRPVKGSAIRVITVYDFLSVCCNSPVIQFSFSNFDENSLSFRRPPFFSGLCEKKKTFLL